jgi:hypothetical protein
LTKFYKVVRENYMDFATGTVHYGVGAEVRHPEPGEFGKGEAEGYLSVTTDPSLAVGASWPCRVLEVEADEYWEPHQNNVWEAYTHKRAVHKLRVVRELDAWEFFGPQGKRVVDILTKQGELKRAVDRSDYGSRKYLSVQELSSEIRVGKRGLLLRWQDEDRHDALKDKRETAVSSSGWGLMYLVIQYLIIADLLDPENKRDAAMLAWIEDSIEKFEKVHYDVTTSWWRKTLDYLKGKN